MSGTEIDPTQDGKTVFTVTADPSSRLIYLIFNAPLSWVSFYADDAKGLIEVLKASIKELERTIQ